MSVIALRKTATTILFDPTDLQYRNTVKYNTVSYAFGIRAIKHIATLSKNPALALMPVHMIFLF